MSITTAAGPLNLIDKLETDICQSSDRKISVDQLRQTITLLSANMDQFGSMRSQNISCNEMLRSYTVLAGQITDLIVRGTEEIDYDAYVFLSIFSQEIGTIFNASGYRGALHALKALGQIDGEQFDIKIENIPAACLVLNINEVPNELLKQALKVLDPSLSVPLILGWLRESFIYSELAEANLKTLHENSHLIANAAWNDNYLLALHTVYMYCSYANFDHRLELKRAINHLLRARFLNYDKLTAPKKKKSKNKPKLIVLHEHFKSSHSMFRCFARMLGPLKNYFTTIAFAETGHIDERSETLFDQIYLLDNKGKFDLRDLIQKINNIAPDVVLYPSIGMSVWAIILSNFRLAPIQITGQGHPGSSMSKAIDYAIIPEVTNDVTKYYSEKVITHKNLNIEVHPKFSREHRRPPNLDRDHVKIAVNSKVMKLSPEFLQILRSIELAARSKIEFHFFPAAHGMVNDYVSSIVSSEFKNSIIHNETDYSEFLTKLSLCDFCCAAFPFGNTNGTMDACLLGMPSFSVEGTHLGDQNDSIVIKLFDFPRELISFSKSEYKNKILRMVDDHNYRQEILNKCWKVDVEGILHINNSDSYTSYADAIYKAFSDH